MECRTYLADELTLPVGPGAIGQQNYRNIFIKVDPEGAAAVAEMANGMH